ncbi:hypothetical protein [Sphingobium aromaticiconvertens]|uniref:hypothetical protein n=1 Tax=Sphingobium aromaticiconvertens TaxID=365341 RepID=UPI003015D775
MPIPFSFGVGGSSRRHALILLRYREAGMPGSFFGTMNNAAFIVSLWIGRLRSQREAHHLVQGALTQISGFFFVLPWL